MKSLADSQVANMQLEHRTQNQDEKFNVKMVMSVSTDSIQFMYLLSTQLGNLKVQLINMLEFICHKRTLCF